MADRLTAHDWHWLLTRLNQERTDSGRNANMPLRYALGSCAREPEITRAYEHTGGGACPQSLFVKDPDRNCGEEDSLEPAQSKFLQICAAPLHQVVSFASRC